MNNDVANFASDLRRIAYWLMDERFELAKHFLTIARGKYKSINGKVGGYEDIWNEVKKIENLDGGKERAAERALTASVIFQNCV